MASGIHKAGYQKQYRASHREQVLAGKRDWAARYPNHSRVLGRLRYQRQLTKAILYLGGRCLDCGNEDHEVLEFDHLPEFGPRARGRAVTSLLQGPWSEVLLEMAKCELVCANCHRKRTVARRLAGYAESEMLARAERNGQ